MFSLWRACPSRSQIFHIVGALDFGYNLVLYRLKCADVHMYCGFIWI